MYNGKTNDHRQQQKKGANFTPLSIFIRLSVIRLNSRAGKNGESPIPIGYSTRQDGHIYGARSCFSTVVLKEKILFWP